MQWLNCWASALATPEGYIRCFVDLQARRWDFHETTQLGEATSRAGLRCRQSMPGRSDQRERLREKRPSRIPEALEQR
jgi:hypothetical protein